jgi:1,2-dihydroxy-3-keto-5-methylthiopentene dioxygenase
VLLIAIFVLESEAQPSCTYKDDKGHTYDLSALKNDKQDYKIAKNSAPIVKWDIYLNMCRPLVQPICASGAAGCQQWDPSKGVTGRASMGAYAGSSFQAPIKTGDKGYGVTIQYKNGDGNRQFEIDLVCDYKAGIGAPVFTGESPQLHYNFLWATAHACPTGSKGAGGGLSGGSILLIILLVVAVVYLVAGVLFNKFKRQATGIELIPNVGFWTSLPGLVKDGVMFIVHKITKRGQYTQV